METDMLNQLFTAISNNTTAINRVGDYVKTTLRNTIAIGTLTMVTTITALSTGPVASAAELKSGPVYQQVLKLRDRSPSPSVLAHIRAVEWAIERIEAAKNNPLHELVKFVFGGVRRSCGAYLAVATETGATKVGNEFQARRGAGNFVKNRARRRARDASHACMAAKWAGSPNAAQLCSARSGVMGFTIGGDLEQLARHTARTIASSGRRVGVYAVTHGDRGCGVRENRRKVEHLGNVIVP